MFDTTINEIRTGMPSRIDIHEHRAPTTDSARFLSELQREAEKRIIATVPLEDNLIKGQVFLHHYYAINAYQLVAAYKVNGKTFETTVEKSAFQIRTVEDQVKFLHELRDKIATDIANDLLNSNLDQRIFQNGPSASL